METTSLGLKKPAGTDPVDLRDFNDNADIIDTALCSRPLKNGEASEMYTKFEMAGSLANIVSGEALKTSMGKLMKALGDYFAHKASLASTTNAGHVKLGKASGTACEGNDSRLSDSRTPKSHAATTNVYGAASATNYGHVKLSDTYTSVASNGVAANGVGASQNALAKAYAELDKRCDQMVEMESFSSRLEWKTLGDTFQTGGKELAFPDGASEISIKVNLYIPKTNDTGSEENNAASVSQEDIVLKLYIPVVEIYQETAQQFRTGYYLSETNGGSAAFSISQKSIALTNAFLNGVEVTNGTSWAVYYR